MSCALGLTQQYRICIINLSSFRTTFDTLQVYRVKATCWLISGKSMTEFACKLDLKNIFIFFPNESTFFPCDFYYCSEKDIRRIDIYYFGLISIVIWVMHDEAIYKCLLAAYKCLLLFELLSSSCCSKICTHVVVCTHFGWLSTRFSLM